MRLENCKITFFLKNPRGDEETLVFALLYFSRNKRFKVSTGIKIHPKSWNQNNNDLPVRKGHPQSQALNKKLKTIKRDYEDVCLNAFLIGKEVTKEYFLNHTKYARKPKVNAQFFDVWEDFIRSKKNHCTALSMNKYHQARKHLEGFQRMKGITLTFESIDLLFYENFTHFLLEESLLKEGDPPGTKSGLYNSSAEKLVKCIKTFMNYSFENGLHENLAFKKFKGLKDNSEEIIALSIDELNRIESLPPISRTHDIAKELFLILCYTGLRFSDLKTLNGKSIKDGMIYLTTQKTNDVIKIPVHRKLEILLRKFSEDKTLCLPSISNPKMNKLLKDIGREAGLTEICKKIRYKGANAQQIINKEGSPNLRKWELLTTHTGRRTFATLSLFLGMDSESVKKITGHKSDRTFKKYVRYSDQQLKDKIKVWEI